MSRLQDQSACLNGAGQRAAFRDGQATERLQIAFELPGQHDILDHAQLSLEDQAGMNFENNGITHGETGSSRLHEHHSHASDWDKQHSRDSSFRLARTGYDYGTRRAIFGGV